MIVNEFSCFSVTFDEKFYVEGRLFELSDRNFARWRPKFLTFGG